MAPVVYHIELGQSDRALWICEEVGIDYELKRFNRLPGSFLAPPELKKISPTGTAPVITDTYLGKPVTIAETGAVLQYIDAIYGEGKLSSKPGDADYADFIFWFNFAGGSFMPELMMKMAVLGIPDAEEKSQAAFLLKRLNDYLPMIEKRLSEVPYLAGDKFTIADMLGFFGLTTMRSFVTIDLSPFPLIQKYVERVSQRPAYQRAMQKAEPKSDS